MLLVLFVRPLIKTTYKRDFHICSTKWNTISKIWKFWFKVRPKCLIKWFPMLDPPMRRNVYIGKLFRCLQNKLKTNRLETFTIIPYSLVISFTRQENEKNYSTVNWKTSADPLDGKHLSIRMNNHHPIFVKNYFAQKIINSNKIYDPLQTTAFSLVYLLSYFLYCKMTLLTMMKLIYQANKNLVC